LPLPSFRRRNEARKQIGTIVKNIIKYRRSTANRPEENDVIEILMSQHFRTCDDRAVTDDEIAGLCIALTLAGQHTSTITLTWLLLFALSKPEILARIMKEQQEVRGSKEHILLEDVEQMTYLHDTMKETLRLRPPIILVWRKVSQDFQYKDYIIPRGTLVCVSPAAYPRMHDSVYTNPNEFDPPRFGDRAEHRKSTYTFLSFSQGRHSCIGEKFAFLQVRTVLSVLFHLFELKLVGTIDDYPVDNTTVLAGPKGPVRVRYERLHK